MLEEKRKQLLDQYRRWEKEYEERIPIEDRVTFSYPYYLHIPDNWLKSSVRILIVGEEGYGEKAYDTPIEEAQAFNRDYLVKQLGPNRDNRSAFWQRIRKIAKLVEPFDFAMTWTNLDKVHRSGKGNCRLRKESRKALHSTPTHILQEEIRILQPTHVLYFGWYGFSLKGEFQDELLPVFNALYPNDLGDGSGWEPRKIKTITETGIHHIFTYHPGWGQRQKDGYEEAVLEEIMQSLKMIKNYN